MTEISIMRAVLVAVTALPGTLMWRNNTGVFLTRDGRVVTIGLPGAPDIIGVHRGRAIGIEVKTATGHQSDAQRRFQAARERVGGIYIVARSPDQAVQAVRELVG